MPKAPVGTRWNRVHVVASNLRYLQVLEQATDALTNAKIPFLCLKGAAYLDLLYPDLMERRMCDVDVLVDPAQLRDSRRALESAGFRFLPPPLSRRETWDEHYNWQFTTRDGALFELHTAFCPHGAFSIDYDGVWERALTYEACDRFIPTLSPEDTLVYASIHEAKHAFSVAPEAREDIRRIIATWRPDWTVVVARAKEWGARASLYVTLKAAKQHGADIPSAVLVALKPSRVKRAMIRALLSKDSESPRLPGHSPWAQLATSLAVADDPRQNARLLSKYASRRARDFMGSLRSRDSVPRLPQ